MKPTGEQADADQRSFSDRCLTKDSPAQKHKSNAIQDNGEN